ncbi:glycoside hydrolase family 6 protein [Streptomyces sp. 4N509B]|uniref:glycoside hydrolase family 6 protein n=1 Tax=Streptomyces sp. 4N509B TaxID=3457413 RepID=UPI003FCF2079
MSRSPLPRPRVGAPRRAPLRAAVVALSATLALLAALAAVFSPAAAQPPPPTPTPTPSPKLDNPYAGDARVYVDPEWSAQAASEPGGEAVSGQPTAVWLDSVDSLVGDGVTMGLPDHLDTALAQGADVVQLVLYNAPGRDCALTRSDGEFAHDEIDRYRFDFLDPVAEILSDPAYAELRFVAVIEPFSLLPYLTTHVSPRPEATPECDAMLAGGGYARAIGHAVATLGALPNVYPYLDIAHHGWFAEQDTAALLPAAVDLLAEAATAAGGSLADVHGLATNVSNHGLLTGDVDTVFDGELAYAAAFRAAAVAAGFDAGLGLLVDTSRNGWADGRDLRADRTYWCNQPHAGLGERPTAAPAPGVDAYAWLKPPGRSDGSPEAGTDGQGFAFAECDPDRTGALPDAPPTNHWFSAHFRQLLAAAHPPL